LQLNIAPKLSEILNYSSNLSSDILSYFQNSDYPFVEGRTSARKYMSRTLFG